MPREGRDKRAKKPEFSGGAARFVVSEDFECAVFGHVERRGRALLEFGDKRGGYGVASRAGGNSNGMAPGSTTPLLRSAL